MIGLLWNRANVHLGSCLGRFFSWANAYQFSVRGLLSGQVTVRVGYCPVELLSVR